MRNYPTDEYDLKELSKINAEEWMVECLKMNPSYTCWGPYEDYMWKEGGGWDCSVIKDSWEEFGPWQLDEYNEIVNFYFSVDRESEKCFDCDGSGLNKPTKQLSDEWYSFGNEKWIYMSGGKRYNDMAWQYHLTDIEVDALWNKKRLQHDFKTKPTPEMVNEWSKKGFGHDAINHWICVEARAKALGYYGKCDKCVGDGILYTEPAAKLGLILWVLHPRKGCSRGVHIKKIERSEMSSVFDYLLSAEKRNADRFSGLRLHGSQSLASEDKQ